jgi:phospholipase/lecithinase/hemolysin
VAVSGNFLFVKSLQRFIAIALFVGGLVCSARAGFSSIYVFGDSLSATATNNATGILTNYYYGGTLRYSNGRTWVEVLAQRQGLGANSITNANWTYSSNNLSFYGNFSALLVTNVNGFSPPANATNCLFVLWVCNADFVGDIGAFPPSNNNWTNQAQWTAAINQHLTNHFSIITNLYAKGCRTLVAPNAADVTTVPEYNNDGAAYRTLVRQQITNFNASYAVMLQQIRASSPGLMIYNPDIFSLFNNVLTNAASYGLTNVLSSGQPIDAMDNLYPACNPTNGPGTNYIFWDYISPTAAMGEVIADFAQQYISPVQFSAIKQVNGSNRLDVVNMPIGLTNGFVLSATNLTQKNWLTNASFTTLTTPQSLFVPVAGAQQFYRLQFPWQWSWP